jgi:hypothetical protein
MKIMRGRPENLYGVLAEDTNYAMIILKQLGGNTFIRMTGAKDFVKYNHEKKLAFRIGRNNKSVNYVTIVLNGKDLYDMKFIRMRNTKMAHTLKVVSYANDVYFDQLQDIFTQNTGMYTHL